MAWVYDPDSQDYTYQDAQDDDTGLASSSFMDNMFQEQQEHNRNSQVATLDKTVGYQPEDMMKAVGRVVGGLKGYGQTLANMTELQNQPSAEQIRQQNIQKQIEAEEYARLSNMANTVIGGWNGAADITRRQQAVDQAPEWAKGQIAGRVGLGPQDEPADYNPFHTDVPYWSDFARGTLQPAVREGGNLLRPPTEIFGQNVPGIGDIAAGFVPSSVGDVALAAAPFAGELRGAPGALGRGLRGYGGRALESGLGQESALSNEITAATRFRNPLEVPPEGSTPYYTGIYPEDRAAIEANGLRPGTALTPDRDIAEAYAQRRAEMMGGEPTTLQFNMRPEDVEASSYYYTSPNTQYPNELSMVGGGSNEAEGPLLAGGRPLPPANPEYKSFGLSQLRQRLLDSSDAASELRLDWEHQEQVFAGKEKIDAAERAMREEEGRANALNAEINRREAIAKWNIEQRGLSKTSMVGGGANIPENLDFATARAALKGLGYDADNMTRADIEHLIQDINAGKVTNLPESQPNVPRNVPVSDAELEAQTRLNLGLEGGNSGGEPPIPPRGRDFTEGSPSFGPEPGTPQGVSNPGAAFPATPDVVEPEATKSLAQKVWEGTIGNAGALTGLKSSLTPPALRQGKARLVTSPVAWLRELGTSLKGGLNEANYTKVMDIIEQDPMVRKSAGPIGQANMDSPIPAGYSYQDRGGTILQAGAKADVNTLPEELQVWKQSPIGRHLEESKLGGWSERQAALEMNLHRTNWYKEAASALWQSGETNPDRYTALVKEIEHFTQRGSVSQGQVPVMFSTRAISGRIQGANDLFTNGVIRGVLGGQALRPGVAREATKVLVGEAIYNSIRMGIPVALGVGSIELKDGLPTLKIGNQHFDPWAGFGSMSKVVYRTAVAVDKANKGDTGQLSGPQFVGTAAGKELQSYARKSLGPAFAKGADVFTGKDVFGRKYDVEKDVKSGKFFTDLAAPLLISDLWDAWKVAGAGGVALRAPSSFLSEGGNDYVPNEPESDGFDWSGGGKSTSGGTSSGFDWSK